MDSVRSVCWCVSAQKAHSSPQRSMRVRTSQPSGQSELPVPGPSRRGIPSRGRASFLVRCRPHFPFLVLLACLWASPSGLMGSIFGGVSWGSGAMGGAQ